MRLLVCTRPGSARVRSAIAFALLLALAPAATAQQCQWGVDFPGWPHRFVFLSSDGGHGLLAVSAPKGWVDHATHSGTLRLHHVLEQGVLDPALPDTGVTFFVPPPAEMRRGVLVMQVLPDAAGGAWVLAMHNNPFAPKLQWYETATFRLHHVTGQGAVAPGWVAGGLLIPASFGRPDLQGHVSMVPDAAGGVVAVWIAPALYPRTYIRAQRFAQDGTPLWPGGIDGVMVSDSLCVRAGLRIAGDGAGGFGAAVTTQLPPLTESNARAFRVGGDGSRVWPLAGVVVYAPVGQHELPEVVALDGNGELLVVYRSETTTGAPSQTVAQLLSPSGSLQFDPYFGLVLGPATPGGASAVPVPSGFVTVQGAEPSGTAMQLLDSSGSPAWGPEVNGVPSPPYSRPPIPFASGDVAFVWADPASIWQGPPTVIRALEIGGDGLPAPGWPPEGLAVCSASEGHVLTDARSTDGLSLDIALGSDWYSAVAPRVMRLSRAVLDVPPATGQPTLRLAPPSPNPARGDWTLRLSLGTEQRVTLELHDVMGRLVRREAAGLLPAGPHVLRFSAGPALAPGVYRLRVRAGSETAECRVVCVR